MDKMKRLAHLEVHEVALDMVGPLYIGDGRRLGPEDFVFDEGAQCLRLLRFDALETAIARAGLAEAWAAHLASKTPAVGDFIRAHGLEEALGPALPLARHAQAVGAVRPFLRRPDGRAYLPGSTLKGAIATALMTWQLNEMPREDRAILAAEVRRRLREMPAGAGWTHLEHILLKILPVNYQDLNNPVNSMMRVYSFDDSDPIDEGAFVLAARDDAAAEGTAGLGEWRETVRPGTTIRTRLTIDTVMMARTRSMLTVLSEALENWQLLQERVYHDRIRVPNRSPVDRRERYIYLGGGAGIVSKVLLFALFDEGEARALLNGFLAAAHPAYRTERGRETAPYLRHISRIGEGELPPAYDVGKARITIHY